LVERIRWLDSSGNVISSRQRNQLNQVNYEFIQSDSEIAQGFALHGITRREELPDWQDVIDYRRMCSPLDFAFHTKASFRAGSLHDPAVLPFVLHMCAGHPLGWLCAPIAEHGLDLPSLWAPWGGELFGKQYPMMNSPPRAKFRNSKKCNVVCDNGMPG
jgi:hypothetical protein